jgi:hypothetical protein
MNLHIFKGFKSYVGKLVNTGSNQKSQIAPQITLDYLECGSGDTETPLRKAFSAWQVQVLETITEDQYENFLKAEVHESFNPDEYTQHPVNWPSI